MHNQIHWGEFVNKSGYSMPRIVLRKVLNIIVRFTLSGKLRNMIYKLIGVNVGNNVFIGMDCYLDDNFPELITIEDDVIISFRVTVVAHDRKKFVVSPITIKKGAFIGTGTIILPGVIIGEGAIVGAGSVTSKDVAPYSTVIGIPAKQISYSKSGRG